MIEIKMIIIINRIGVYYDRTLVPWNNLMTFIFMYGMWAIPTLIPISHHDTVPYMQCKYEVYVPVPDVVVPRLQCTGTYLVRTEVVCELSRDQGSHKRMPIFSKQYRHNFSGAFSSYEPIANSEQARDFLKNNA